jgi:hypothetical protein
VKHTDGHSNAGIPPIATLRFVIQHHRTKYGEHWDLMLQSGPMLATWQLWRSPETVGDGPIPATRIGDHRKAYLTYEGPLTGDRGTVEIFDRGTLKWRAKHEDRIVVELHGEFTRGTFVLSRTATQPSRWTFDATRRQEGAGAPDVAD